MEASKVFTVRSHVLGLLESGQITEGQQIPPARDLAHELDISFAKVQHGIDALCRDGLLEAHPRQGVFVLQGWRDRVLQDNLSVFDKLHRLPWLPGLLDMIHEEIPDLRITKHFSRSILEIKTTLHVLTRHEEYMDLSTALEDCYPDKSVFFEKAFDPFRINGRLVGIPFSFSPRVIYCNPKLFKKATCTLPAHGWTSETFLETIQTLCKTLPPEQVLNWHGYPFLWMTFVFRAGGRLFDPSKPDPVCIDHPNTLAGLHYFKAIGKALGKRPDYDDDKCKESFVNGETAMFIADRLFTNRIKISGFEDWITVPLPSIPGGQDVTAQATDLICVRNSCSSPLLVRKLVRMILSEPVQDRLAQEKASIPIRRSSAFKSFDLDDTREAILITEMTKVCNDFHLASPYPGELVLKGIQRILDDNLDIDKGCKELASLARTTLGIRNMIPENSPVVSEFAVPSKRIPPPSV
ncbi:extracellular solute-binding protein [Kiritimatiellota bacterium B12222]|nr:extracellular solute-binding protein [Kiritimatiellota bacterium B12222]